MLVIFLVRNCFTDAGSLDPKKMTVLVCNHLVADVDTETRY